MKKPNNDPKTPTKPSQQPTEQELFFKDRPILRAASELYWEWREEFYTSEEYKALKARHLAGELNIAELAAIEERMAAVHNKGFLARRKEEEARRREEQAPAKAPSPSAAPTQLDAVTDFFVRQGFRVVGDFTHEQVRAGAVETTYEQIATRKLFEEALSVDREIAELLVEAGFTTIEDIANAPDDRLAIIEGFDEEIVKGLHARARAALASGRELGGE